jgi:hypothetical protein
MSNVDTSAEAVDALINRHRLVASTWRMSVSDHERTAATLRALLAERDALREALLGLMVGCEYKTTVIDDIPLTGWHTRRMPDEEALDRARAALEGRRDG